jgi:hypothetical protein
VGGGRYWSRFREGRVETPREERALRAGKTRSLNSCGLGSSAKKMALPTVLKSRVLDLGQGMRFSRTLEKSEGVRRAERLDGGGGEGIIRFVWGKDKWRYNSGGNVSEFGICFYKL